MPNLVRVLFIVVSLAGSIGGRDAFAACISGGQVDDVADCIAADKGSKDCLLAWSVDFDGAGNPPLDDGEPTSNVVCTDGAACDRDGHVNGRCTFHVGACVNAPVGGCTAATLAIFEVGKPSQKDVDKKSGKDPNAVYTRRALVNEIGAVLGGVEACTPADLELVVNLKSKRGVCNSPIGEKCTNDQDCDDYCVLEYKKNKAGVKVEVNDGVSLSDSDSLKFSCLPAVPGPGQCTEVFQVTNAADLVGGPIANGRINDWMLRNSDVRVVVRDVGREFSFMRTYGGAIIDADLTRDDPADDRDNWLGMQPMVHIAGTQNTQSISVLNDGSDCAPGILRTSGPDDLFDVLSPDVAIFSAGNTLSVPLDTVGIDLPLNLTTDYLIRHDRPYVQVATTFENTSGTDLELFVGDYVNAGGQGEDFAPGVGFGQPLLRKGGDGGQGAPQGLDFLASQGVDEARGVTYGLVLPRAPGSDPKVDGTFLTGAFTQSGVSAWVHNQDLVGVLNASPAAKPPGPFVVPALGTNTLRRWFVVGETISDVTKARAELFGDKIGMIQGTITSGGQPVANAHVAFLRVDIGGNRCGSDPIPCKNVFSATLSDEFGFYRGFLPAGDYDVRFRGTGVPYEGSAAAPPVHFVKVKGGKAAVLDAALPDTGAIRVTIEDQNGDPIAGKVSVVGFEAAPDPRNLDSIAGFIDSIGRYFGYDPQEKDRDNRGLAKVIFTDHSGDTGTVDLEPGTYHVVVSHGYEYDVYDQQITVTAGATTNITAPVNLVVDTTGFVSIDTHVHSIDSPDADVTRTNRVISMLAEGVDFFVPTDHDHVSDFSDEIASIGATGLISTAPSDEITTFNYGHFNVWPLTVNSSSITGGALDWGRSGQTPGAGYVGNNSYDLLPSEVFGSFNPATQVIQINHFNSGTLGHFNNLGIDTEAIPPQSSGNVFRCSGGTRGGLPCQAKICLGDPNDADPCATNADCTPGVCNAPPLGRDCPGGTCVDVPDNLSSFLRLDPAVANLYADTFTTLEVWIEADRGQTDLMLNENMADWAGLLNQGKFKSGVADSDTHNRIGVQAGGPRTFVASATDDPGSIDASALAANVIDGRAIGSGGLFMRVELEGDGGAIASHALGDPRTVAATSGTGMVHIHVESPPWAEYDRIEVYANSDPDCQSEFTFFGVLNRNCDVSPLVTLNKVAGPPGPNQFNATLQTGVSGSGQRYVTDVSTTLSLADDTWVIVVARGTDGVSQPLFPVLPVDMAARQCVGGPNAGDSCVNNAPCTIFGTCQNVTLADLTDGGTPPPWNLNEGGQLAAAFSNPLLFDRQNDGTCHGGTPCP